MKNLFHSMNFIFQFIFSFFIINAAFSIATEEKHKLNTFSLDINVDYNLALLTME